MTDSPAPPRRFRFGLRSLFVVVTVALLAGLILPALTPATSPDRGKFWEWKRECENQPETLALPAD